jgi:hypothetical protein
MGKVDVKLSDLAEKSEIHGVFDLMDSNGRRPAGGKLELRIRLREPLVKKQTLRRREKWIVSNETDLSLFSPFMARKQSEQKATLQPPQSAPASVRRNTPPSQQPTLKPKTPEAPTPAAAPSADDATQELMDIFDRVDLIVSNNVLEAEQAQLNQKIATEKVRGKISDELVDKQQQIQIRMQLLVIQVQSGQLTMEAYVTQLRQAIERTKTMAVAFKKAGQLEYAKRALQRMKIMQAEADEVDQASQ